MEGALQLWYFNQNWQKQLRPLPCGVMGITESLPGVMHARAVAARQFKIRGVQQIQRTHEACCDSGRWICLYLRLWSTQSYLWKFANPRWAQGGAADSMQSQSHLLYFWQMDPWWLGVLHALAVTFRQFKISLGIVAAEFAFAALLADGSVVTWGYAAHSGDSSAVQDWSSC